MAITHSTHEAPTQEVALPSALAGTFKPRMQSARDAADALETLVDARAWPMPTYSEVLHHHQ